MRRNLQFFFYTVLILFLLVAYFFFRQMEREYSMITNFKDCKEAGFEVSQTQPEQCKIPGKVFVNSPVVTEATTTQEEVTLSPEKNMNPKNATYVIEGEQVTLINGLAVKNGITFHYFGNETQADFDGDGKEDTTFLLTTNSSGTGTFYYLVVALNKDDGYTGTNALFIGDRIAPQTTEFKDAEIIVNYADRNPNEPMVTKPSLGVSRYFKIVNGSLVEVKK